MSRQYLEHYGFVGDDYLEHYGVKGMKWRNRRRGMNNPVTQRRIQGIADHMASGGTGNFADFIRAARMINLADDLDKKGVSGDIQARIRPFKTPSGEQFIVPVGNRQTYSMTYTDPSTGRVYTGSSRVTTRKKRFLDEVRERQRANRKKNARSK